MAMFFWFSRAKILRLRYSIFPASATSSIVPLLLMEPKIMPATGMS